MVICVSLHYASLGYQTKNNGTGYGYGSRRPKKKFQGYGSLVAHTQFTAVSKYGNAISEQSLAIHTAEYLRIQQRCLFIPALCQT